MKMTSKQATRLHNFSGGPGAVPEGVLAEASSAVVAVPGVGLSVHGISHRSSWFRSVLDEAELRIRRLLGLENEWHVLFLQGGATLQFAAIPMIMGRGAERPAEYLHTGYWSGKAIAEAARLGAAHRVVWSGRDTGFRRLPVADEVIYDSKAAYLHWIDNETVEGLRFTQQPGVSGVPRVVDLSSSFLSKPMDLSNIDVAYAHAQKNLGPAGVTVVLVRDRVLKQVPDGLPSMLDWRVHVRDRSIHNTPPVAAIHIILLVLRWLEEDIGGLEAMSAINTRKAAALYAALDGASDYYKPYAAVADRSLMNVTFYLHNPAQTAHFLAAAERAGLMGLGGHRSIGGLRASLYNAVTETAVTDLCAFLEEYRRANP